MKTMLASLLALCLMLALCAPAAVAEAAPVLEGMVTEITETGFLMNDLTLGPVEVLLAPDTAWEGVIAAPEDVAVGQYLFVLYDGKLTRSIPPQVTAGRVSCFAITGTVGEVLDGSALVTGDAIFGDVLVRYDPSTAEWPLAPGMPITVYYNGVMAMSLPGQIGALLLDVPTLIGEVSDLTAEGFTLTDAQGVSTPILLTADTVGAGDLRNGVHAEVICAPVADALSGAESGATEGVADGAADGVADGATDSEKADGAADGGATDSVKADGAAGSGATDSEKADGMAEDGAGISGEPEAPGAFLAPVPRVALWVFVVSAMQEDAPGTAL